LTNHAISSKVEAVPEVAQEGFMAADTHSDDEPPPPVVPAEIDMPELTWAPVLLGVILGIVFGASSLYLVLKVGMTVSASIPVAVLSITLFRLLPFRRATILENNIVQTTGSAGESIAFGVGVTMPALLLIGFDLDLLRVMTVAVLGGLLGIFMMIPMRQAFLVKQHRELVYPEGRAAAQILKVGDIGGATAANVFAGFGLGFLFKFLVKPFYLFHEEVAASLTTKTGAGLKGGVVGSEMAPELLGVGYIIGPRIASIMLGGGVLAYLVLAPLIMLVGSPLDVPLPPAQTAIEPQTGVDKGLIRNMDVGDLRSQYILYIGAGAVTTGGIISMFQAAPLILASITGGLRGLRRGRNGNGNGGRKRTDRDLPTALSLFGAIGLVVALVAAPNVGLGFSAEGIVGGVLVVAFGFLFVTVSARLTGQVGSSSNPISGMTVATLLLTCLIFLAMGKTDKAATLTALTLAGVVCIAASNGGTVAQCLKTGQIVGATPARQQIAILVGALTSALVIGVTLLALNAAGTIYTARAEYLPPPDVRIPDSTPIAKYERPGGEYAAKDAKEYGVVTLGEGELNVKRADGSEYTFSRGKYLVDENRKVVYYVDPAINGRVTARVDGQVKRVQDNGDVVSTSFEAPKTQLMALIIDGILNQRLPWELVIIGALIAITLELAGVPSLPFAVGVYLPLQTSMPIFIGGMIRYTAERVNKPRSEAEADSSPGVLLSSGYIAGGTIAGVVAAFMTFLGDSVLDIINLNKAFADNPTMTALLASEVPTLAAFGALMVILLVVGVRKREDPGLEPR
jgi:putative OPT family oligopeptide transporter